MLEEMIQALLGRFQKHSAATSLNPAHSPGARTVVTQDSSEPTDKVLAKLLPTRPGTSGVTFSVDKVEPTAEKFLATTLLDSLEMRAGTRVLILPNETALSVAPGGSLTKHHRLDEHQFLNPLIEAIHLAFSQHRPLILSPDCIWLTIVQGFGHHLNQNAEALRGRIVRHKDQKVLQVRTESLEPAAWPSLVSQFSEQIQESSDPVLHETLLCDFSTTTPIIRTAFEVALMDAYKRYFKFVVMCVCGIPCITLEGSPEDWQRIRERIEVLATFGLEWWTSRLALILDEFISTAKGAPDLSFWQAIYKPEQVYASEMATGWIADLFPYLGTESDLRRNFMLEKNRIDWLPPETDRPTKGNFARSTAGVSLEAFPCGLSHAPVTVTFPDKPSIEVDLLGGFVGISQSDQDRSLAPIISWAVVARDARVGKPSFSKDVAN